MIAMLIAVAAQAASPPLIVGAKPYIGTRRTKVDDETYRVTIKASGEVIVAAKSIIGYRNMKRHDRMHQAVTALTGCALADEMWMGNILHGKLDCSS